jgi:hypothetical protein
MASSFLNGLGVRCGTGGRQRGRNGLFLLSKVDTLAVRMTPFLPAPVMELPADPGLALVAFSAEAGSPADALRFLASRAATHEPADALATPNQTQSAKHRSYREGRPAQRHPA